MNQTLWSRSTPRISLGSQEVARISLANAGRNSIIGPNLFNVDFSVHKDFAAARISEAFKV
jgi:hypothetical protein